MRYLFSILFVFSKAMLLAQAPATKPAAPAAGSYVFNTTNFDDGWTSVIQEDWVEVTKGAIKVLLHYPKKGTLIAGDPKPVTNNAWDILVAPRYANLRNYKVVSPSLDYQRSYLGVGEVTDKNGQTRYVALYMKNQNTGWMEFICASKIAFVQQFGVDADKIDWGTSSDVFKPLIQMTNYNKFAIATTDFKGKYTDQFASNTYYASVFTGLSTGMSSYSSNEWFEFGAGQQYKWQLTAANSYKGRTNIAQGKGAGTFKAVNNWQLWFSNIEGKQKTYDAFFTAVKGGRVLWLKDAQNATAIYTGYSK